MVFGACDSNAPSPSTSTTSTTTATSTSTTTTEPFRGATYHVTTAGDDAGDGSAALPWRTLGHALEQLEPGDTLVVGGGTYEERLRELDIRGGSERAPIRVEAAPGERPVIEGLLWLDDPDHWSLRGINVTWSPDSGNSEHMVKFTDGDAWSFTDAEVWGARSFAAILVAGSPKDFRLSGLYVHDTERANGRNEDHLVYLNSGTGGGIVERNVLANSPNGRAIKIGAGEEDGPAVANLVIRYNTMYRNLGPSNVQVAWSTSDVEIYRNVFVEPAPDRANVTAFELRGDGVVVRDNLGWGGRGVLDESDSAGVEDGGGNVALDPRLRDPAAGDFEPGDEEARAYGRSAP